MEKLIYLIWKRPTGDVDSVRKTLLEERPPRPVSARARV